MIELAWLSLNDEFGRDTLLPVKNLKSVRQDPDGSGAIVTFTDGTELELTESASDVMTAIDTLWTEYLTAVTG